jgi:hypothetical protein
VIGWSPRGGCGLICRRGAEEGLLVLDNATDPDGVCPFLPAAGGTQVVVTTTDRAFAELGQPVDVSALTRPQSVGDMRRRPGWPMRKARTRSHR